MCLILISFFSRAQNESDLANFLQASKTDASKLIGAYTSPVIKGVSYGMTGGWYHTGKTHSKLGVDLGFTLNAVFIPSSDNYFNPAAIGLSSSTVFTNTTYPGKNAAPTFVGPKDVTSYTSTYDPDGAAGPFPSQSFAIKGPEGLDMKKNLHVSAVPVPMVQLGIGLIMNTDIKIRLIPKIDKGNSTVKMFGVGLMHDIKQHIPGIKMLPFDLSVLAAYNSLTGTTSLVNTNSADTRPDSPDGKISYKLSSWVVQGVISKKFSVVTLYAGLGYGSVTTNVDITGTFNIGTPGIPINIKDPVSIDFKNNSAKVTTGLRLKFGPIYLVGDYTLQKYKMLTVGLGVSVR